MNKRRILALASFLEKLPRKAVEHFDMGSWLHTEGIFFDPKDLTKGCGASACALGWATQMPSMRKLGLRLYEGRPILGTEAGFGAAQALFGLDREQAYYLFDAVGLPDHTYKDETPKQWAKRARRFVASGGEVPQLPQRKEGQ